MGISSYLSNRLVERLDLAKTVTPLLLKNQPIFNWYFFRHSYSPELVKEIINLWNLSPNAIIADPFCGTGTTLLTANMYGYRAIGSDIHPVALLASKAKTQHYNILKLKQDYKVLIKSLHIIGEKAISKRFSRAFTKREYSVIRALYKTIKNISPKNRGFFLLALISILPQISRAIGDGGWLRWVDKQDQSKKIIGLFRKKVEQMLVDFEHKPFTSVVSKIYDCDARNFDNLGEKIDAVITSPPYPNRHDYTRVYHIELLLTLNEDEKRIFKLRKESLRSNVEATYQDVLDWRKKPDILYSTLDQLSTLNVDSRIPKMIEGYFKDMYLVLISLRKSLTIGGRIAFVVGNTRYGGLIIPVDEILSQIGEMTGLVHECTWICRYRGNSAQQMKIFGKKAMRESVVFFKKVLST